MTSDVYIIPALPKKEKGAKLDKFFSRHKGNKANPVTPSNVWLRVTVLYPIVFRSAQKVSAKIMLYAMLVMKLSTVPTAAGIQAEEDPTELSHVSPKVDDEESEAVLPNNE